MGHDTKHASWYAPDAGGMTARARKLKRAYRSKAKAPKAKADTITPAITIDHL